MARPQCVLPRRRAGVPHILHQRPRRRGDGDHLELPRHHAARPAGDLGGLARGLPPDPAVQVVELARQLRRRGRASPEVGRGVRRWRSHLPKARRRGESMTEVARGRTMKDITRDELGAPKIVDRSTFQAELDALRLGISSGNQALTRCASEGIWNLAEFHPAVPAIGVLARHASLLSSCGRTSLTPLIRRSANDVVSQDERLYRSRACNAFAYAYFHFGPAAPFHNALRAGTAPEGC